MQHFGLHEQMAAAAQAHHSLASDTAKLGQPHFTDRYGLQWEWCTVQYSTVQYCTVWCTDTNTIIIIIIIIIIITVNCTKLCCAGLQSDLVDISANFSLCYHDDQLLSICMMIRSQCNTVSPLHVFLWWWLAMPWSVQIRNLVTKSLMFSRNMSWSPPRAQPVPPTLGNLNTELVIHYKNFVVSGPSMRISSDCRSLHCFYQV